MHIYDKEEEDNERRSSEIVSSGHCNDETNAGSYMVHNEAL